MNVDVALKVSRRLDSLRNNGRRLEINGEAAFTGVVDDVRGAVSDQVDEDDLCLVIAMLLLGPTGTPPNSMHTELLTILRDCEPDLTNRCKRAYEFAIAYGCGNWRAVNDKAGPWDRIWPNAIRALTRAMEPAVAQCDRWLKDIVVGYKSRSPDDIWSDANLLAMRLVKPEKPLHIKRGERLTVSNSEGGATLVGPRGYRQEVPPGAKCFLAVAPPTEISPFGVSGLAAGTTVLISARDDATEIDETLFNRRRHHRLIEDEELHYDGPIEIAVRECTCGNKKCAIRHRLNAWDPTSKVSLWAFASSAVKGTTPKIQSGSIMQGMYGAQLSLGEEGTGRLRLAPVEYKLCTQTFECSETGQKYEGRRCVMCTTAFDETKTKRDASQRLILAGGGPPPYQREQRCRCRHCQNLYKIPSEDQIDKLVRCSECSQPLFSKEEINRIGKNTDDMLLLARRLTEARSRLETGRPCGHKVVQFEWCPYCNSGLLPAQSATVWVRTFFVATSLDEAKRIEMLRAEDEERERDNDDEIDDEIDQYDLEENADA